VGEGVVIVGAGQAGGAVAAALRSYGLQESVVLVGDEAHIPYQRPPLSKAWLTGSGRFESLALRPARFYAEHGISLRLGVIAVEIDRGAHQVVLDSGERLRYDKLVLATGARARQLPLNTPGVELLTLRTTVDGDRVKRFLQPGRRLAIIGGGYIGLEVAASARKVGVDAVVIESEPRLLARVASPVISKYFHRIHSEHGVEIELGARVADIVSSGDRVVAVTLAGGRKVECDGALVGVGAIPNLELAAKAGLTCLDGIHVNSEAQTSDPDIFAIGDVTWRPLPHYGISARLQSVANALEQGKQAACAIVGRTAPAAEVPWNWSDQYEMTLHIGGFFRPDGQYVIRGDPESQRFSVFHLEGNVVRAVEAVSSPRDFMAARQLIALGAPVDLTKLRDQSVPVRDSVVKVPAGPVNFGESL
jgi:3-phenylpropionate/trans-cinnamate dioxygenase ferredoxin reductase subunit